MSRATPCCVSGLQGAASSGERARVAPHAGAETMARQPATSQLLRRHSQPKPNFQTQSRPPNPLSGDIGGHLKSLFKSGALGEVDLKVIEPKHLVEVRGG
jgi:hypothetical protein